MSKFKFDSELVELAMALKKEMKGLKIARENEENAFTQLKTYLGMHQELGNRDAALSTALENLGASVLNQWGKK